MTVKQIAEKQDRQAVKYEVAKQIRELLDAAAKKYGEDEWTDDDLETEISELVFGEE